MELIEYATGPYDIEELADDQILKVINLTLFHKLWSKANTGLRGRRMFVQDSVDENC